MDDNGFLRARFKSSEVAIAIIPLDLAASAALLRLTKQKARNLHVPG